MNLASPQADPVTQNINDLDHITLYLKKFETVNLFVYESHTTFLSASIGT